MRGAENFTESPVIKLKLKDFAPACHLLLQIRKMANVALGKLGATSTEMYAAEVIGERPSIEQAKLVPAMPLQVLLSIRSQQQSM